MVTTSTTPLAFKWPSALTAQLVVSIRHIDDPAPHGLGAARVPLAESKHKRTRSMSRSRGEPCVHGKGDSEGLDLVMIDPTDNRGVLPYRCCGSVRKSPQVASVEPREN